MTYLLLYCLIIFILTFVLVISVFILMIRFGLFDMKDNPDSITWEEFKGWFKKIKKDRK